MKKKLRIMALTAAMFAGVTAVSKISAEKQVIFINEVRSWDASAKRDGYYGSDYIELYNASKKAVDLSGWYLSDDESDLKKCRIEGVVIDAGDWVILYANGKNDSGEALNFKLNAEGEKIFLSDAQGMLVDSVYVPKQEFGTVYARRTDGSDQWAILEETIGASNDDAVCYPVRNLQSPVFSHESGFYDEAFLLTLEAEAGKKIYYTLDGSIPTENSNVYETGIEIKNISDLPNVCNSVQNVVQDWKEYTPNDELVDKAMVVRAAVIDDEGNASAVVTHTYFVGLEKYEKKNVLSITADFEDLFGDQGIFVTGKGYDDWYLCEDDTAEWVAPNFLQSGRRWESVGNLQFLENGIEKVNQAVGLRTQGASTRMNAKKKMSIYSRKEYSGNAYFDGLTLGGNSLHSIYTNHSAANIVFPELLKDRSVAIQHPMECVVFLNGEYWYDTYILEKYNKYYLKDTYGVDPENVILIKDQSAKEGPEDAYDYYLDVRGFAAINDLSIPEVYEAFQKKADIQSYIDYICANVYLCNMDVSETKNALLWRTIEEENDEFGDTRWRWIMYDMDGVEWMNYRYYHVSEKAAVNSFTEVMQFTQMAISEHKIYASAKNNPEFCKQFVLSFMDMANVNFSIENVKKAFAEWGMELEGSLKSFFKHRFDYIVPYMAEEFELTGTLETVTLKVNDVEGGTIVLNTTTPNLSEGSWSGKYYTDYPVTVTAVPAKGYEFTGWNGSVLSKEPTIEAAVLQGGIELEALFQKNAK